jgi:hypothetical protein
VGVLTIFLGLPRFIVFTGLSEICSSILFKTSSLEKTVLDKTTTCKENIKGKQLINTFIEKKINSGNVSPVKAGQISKEKDKSESLNKCKTVGKLESNVATIVMKKVKPRKSSKTLYEEVLNKIEEQISESPVKTMKRGRPRKMVKTPTLCKLFCFSTLDGKCSVFTLVLLSLFLS